MIIAKNFCKDSLVATIISLVSIDQAISNLNYRSDRSLKYQLVHAIRRFYSDELSVQHLAGVPSEDLIHCGAPATIPI